MASCVAYGCTNRFTKKIPGITFHRFPKDENRKKEWIIALRRKDFTPSQASRVCSAHFPESMIDRTSLVCVRLRENAIPIIFKGYTPYLQNHEFLNLKLEDALQQDEFQVSENEGKIFDTFDRISPVNQSDQLMLSLVKLEKD